MPSFANTALRLLRRVLGAPARTSGPYGGEPTALDGNTAVAATEAALAEAAGLGASFPADTAELAWRAEERRHRANLLGGALETLHAEGPRGALAAACGLALGGTRATAFLSAPDLASALDLLRATAGRRVPLVLHLCNRALPGPAPALGSGHEALHLATTSGCFVLIASNVQEAVDFTLIARCVAEETLTPGLVVMDGEQTALAMQDVRLAPAELVTRFLGRPGDDIQVTDPAQRLVFGEQRRRIPRRHDPDQPVLLGALQACESWGLAAASDVYFDGAVEVALDRAMADLGRQTGRPHEALSSFGMEDARLVLLVQGSAVETAEAVAKQLREKERLKVGVLGLRRLHPFPDAALLAQLDAGQRLLVLERVDTPLSQDPPLLRQLRATLHRAASRAPGWHALGRQDGPASPNPPASAQQELAAHTGLGGLESHAVLYGLGGLPLRGADLMALCRLCSRQQGRQQAIPRYLGMDFAPVTSQFPKRQILLDRLRRDYPGLDELGLRGQDSGPDLRPKGALTLSIHRRSGRQAEGLAAEAAGFLVGRLGERLRSHPALASQPWGSYLVDRVICGPEDLRDPGADLSDELAVLALDPSQSGPDPLADLRPDGALLVLGPAEDGLLWPILTPALQRSLHRRGTQLYALAPPEGDFNAALLGAICGILLERGWLALTPHRLQAAWDARGADANQPAETTFAAGLAGVRRVDYSQLPETPAAAETFDDQAPSVVRALGHDDDRYDSLPRFWDQIGVLYRSGATGELTPDPYLALGAIPPLASAFRDLSGLRPVQPALDPTRCSGCGDCWTLCPDNAMGALALTPRALFGASLGPTGASALQPFVNQLAEGVAAGCRADQPAPATLAGLLERSLERVAERLPAERRESVRAAGERLIAALGALPVAVTEPLYQAPDAEARGTGRLLFLALDPAVCKGCGICVRTCEPGALSSVHRDPVRLALSSGIRETWEGLPDTAEDTLALAADAPLMGSLSASLLARHASAAMVGGDGIEPGSGARLALRLALCVAETHQAPERRALQERVSSAHEDIAGLIRKILAAALPADDLDALARGLAGVDSRQTDLVTFVRQAEGAAGSALDAERLRRLVELAQGLADLSWRLSEGRQGIGQAAVGLVLATEDPAGLAGSFPQNGFRIPVSLDPTGDGAQLAAGLLESQLRQTAGALALLRKARLELERPADARRLWSQLDGLSWRELEAQERRYSPSLLLVGDSGLLAGRGMSQLLWLLGSGLPVKILVLSPLDLGLSDRAGIDSAPARAPDPTLQLALLALSQRHAWIGQSSIAAPAHLFRGLQAALAFPGPALIHLHAPSPGRHGFATDRTLEQARIALESRAFPLFSYDPQAQGVFGSRLDLADNPMPQAIWAHSRDGTPLTPADWAITEKRFGDFFSPLPEAAPKPIRLAAFLALTQAERRGQTPFISIDRPDREPIRYAVAPELVQVCQERREAWRMLQELAGLVTPFTERVRQEAEAAVANLHQAELADQAERYEQRIAGLSETLRDELRHDVRERLMGLAGYARAREN